NLEDGAAAVAYIKVPCTVECDASGYAHPFGVRRQRAIGSDAVNGTGMSRGDVEVSFAIECQTGRIHDLRQQRFDAVVGVDPVKRHRNFLSARTGKRYVDVSFKVDRRI